ncbi:MAG: MmcQ/YjbR family DNA-binding protein [Candidatus Kapaibacterium sp.]|nr:MAG: MmcQ/YjbR family DNA-binding protein [Candidatus Kapabacteria bacterium]
MLTLQEFREYCLQKGGATEELPFDDITSVFKVGGKIFAIAGGNDASTVNLKGNPDILLERRARHEDVQPGYHMNKKHWVSVPLNGSVPRRTLFLWVDDSYNCIVAALPKKVRAELENVL